MLIDKDTAAVGALIISILSFTVSIVNYYKSLEPALNIKITKTEEFYNEVKGRNSYQTPMIFNNSTKNAFNNLSICIEVILDNRDETGNIIFKRYLSNMYMAPQDEKTIPIFLIFTPTPCQDMFLQISYSYYFMLKERTYKILYKWNNNIKEWEWSNTPTEEKHRDFPLWEEQ